MCCGCFSWITSPDFGSSWILKLIPKQTWDECMRRKHAGHPWISPRGKPGEGLPWHPHLKPSSKRDLHSSPVTETMWSCQWSIALQWDHRADRGRGWTSCRGSLTARDKRRHMTGQWKQAKLQPRERLRGSIIARGQSLICCVVWIMFES